MFGKKKNKDEDIIEVDESESKDDVVIEDLDEDLDKDIIEEKKKEEDKKSKKEAKALKKAQEKEELEEINETLDPTPKTRVGTNFRMYKFIIKILITAILLVFGILLLIFKDELIGAVYMVSGVVILFSGLIRLIPLVKSTKSKQARVILLVQCLIHIVLGAYLVFAAFFHWDRLKAYTGNATDNLYEKLDSVSGGWLAKFNIQAYAYILVIFFYTLAMGYFWVTIEYKEPSRKTLFWLNFIAISLAVLIAFFAPQEWFDAEKLIVTLAILAFFSCVVVGGEATGGYIRYRRVISGDTVGKEKRKKKDKGKDAPARNEDIDYSDIDPNTIPQDDPRDSNNIVN